MQNRIYLLLFGFLICIAATAQEKEMAIASVRYQFTHIMDTTQPENPLQENMILYLGKNGSLYTNYDRIERMARLKANAEQKGAMVNMKDIDMSNVKSISVDGGMVSVTTNSGSVMSYVVNPGMTYVNSYFKHQPDEKLSYLASGGGKIFSVDEKLPVIDWVITSDTKQIQGMQCQKATGYFKGRNYTAWFSSQLPYSNGPWKLGGLPGLILEAYDLKKEVVFEFTSFKNIDSSQIMVSVPADAIVTTPKEYKQYQEAILKNRSAMNGGNLRVSGTVSGGTFVGNDGKVIKVRQMNNPIEKNN